MDEASRLIRDQVAAKGGWKGTAVRNGLRAMESLHPGFLEGATARLMPMCAQCLQPHYDRGVESGDVRAHFDAQGPEIADDLLEITDRLAGASARRWLRSTYGVLRPQAREHVLEGLPVLAELLHKHLG
jgi:hypothetical protein